MHESIDQIKKRIQDDIPFHQLTAVLDHLPAYEKSFSMLQPIPPPPPTPKTPSWTLKIAYSGNPVSGGPIKRHLI